MVDVDIGVVVIYHNYSAISCIELNILDLVSSLGPLMRWLLIFLGLDDNLVTHMAPMVDAVNHVGCVRFYLLLIQAYHRVSRTSLLLVLRRDFPTFHQWAHRRCLNKRVSL